jgi:hypothetical protein
VAALVAFLLEEMTGGSAMKRRLGRGLLVMFLAAITLFFPLLAAPHRIDQAHRELIRTGMTVAEVEAIFGVPAGDYDWAVRDPVHDLIEFYMLDELLVAAQVQHANERSGKEQAEASSTVLHFALGNRLHGQTWTSRHGSVRICFDDAGRVTDIGAWHNSHVVPPWQRWWRSYLKK